MEIRRFYIISCSILMLKYIEAKSVSLNELIAAEEQAAQHTTRRSTLFYTSAVAGTESRAGGKKTSPVKYRQNFEIASPSKPSKLKFIQKLRHKRKNLSKKREINHNDGIIQKYIPLLKNIRLLVDNILTTESSETYEPRENKFKRNLHAANEKDDVVCTCERKSNSESSIHPQEETVTSPAAFSTEIQEETITSTIATTTQTFTIVDDHVSRLGRYKKLPVLPTTNSTSIWRNDNGFGKRGSTPCNGSFEGYITRNNGNNERDTREEAGTYTGINEKYTDSYSRNDAGRDRSSERLRILGSESRDTEFVRGAVQEESTLPRSETSEDVARNLPEREREIKHEIRRVETESPLSVSEHDSRLRGFESKEKSTTIRSTEISKESFTENSTSDKRFSNRNGALTSENQEVRAANEAVEPKHILPNSTYPVGKVVMIFDGYSVAKDVNGANKISEKAIQIHT